ncbi:NAD-dependent epimerase/dehydratase family protein [Polynucleobacter sp.]|jgi:UDP-sulfoquinovose synthase|uniref:NAD-dependent epimerase/dehydratase family protein n=1 Tax=Polynucleobacter sp. TaxID=2029855 RepID=UPI0027373DCC|nr:NAD-dependent epimerase/dehydratase family protein [Polynucleobacter sp.]MDP3122550.1 NAD-dependent epimerase/dehydratase family protein [Polynucleobacter sp.]
MKVIILGGDGFCGWPTALHLSKEGHDVTILDNLSRRSIDDELGTNSLTNIPSIHKRLSTWSNLGNSKIKFINIDIAKELGNLIDVFKEEEPEAIIHFAEQRAAPYSMKSMTHEKYTVHNNVLGTHNVLLAINKMPNKKADLVHLGTMGVYGYDGAEFPIPDGYQNIYIENESGEKIKKEILYPANPGSVYHMTKCIDAQLFQFYNKNYKLKITDLHQGIVWGCNTKETLEHPDLVNRFDYDGDYGTVLNRFLIQASINYPLTVHGTGGQTRAFINIKDTVKCIKLAIENPPSGERVRIANQMAETFSVKHLAERVSNLTGAKIAFVNNPRNELEENELSVKNEVLCNLGWNPIKLDDSGLHEIYSYAKKHVGNINLEMIPATSCWNESKMPGIPTL